MARLHIYFDGGETAVSFTAGERLDAVLQRAGVAVAHPCAGRGVCGKCTVELDGQTVLSCRTVLKHDGTVRLSARSMAQIDLGTGEELPLEPAEGVGLAVDIGTTTIAVRRYDLTDGKLLEAYGLLNPQTAVAADVMGRIGHAMNGGLEHLQALVRQAVPTDADRCVLTGNTTMLHLFTGRDPSALSHAPFAAEHLFGEETESCYLPPCMHAFVGADVVCAALACGLTDRDETALLCDVGTNGEIALWHEGVLYIASTAAGPAFEGAGIACGTGSVRGAIERVWVENGQLRCSTIGSEPPVGLCGSGLIDAAAALLQLGVIDETGVMDEERVILAGDVFLSAADVRALHLAKAAVCAGVLTLRERAHLTPDQVDRFCLAGGFGRHLNLDSAAAIGLLPSSLAKRARVLGNASLTGASMLLLSPSLREKAQRIASFARHVPLGGDALFNEHYINCMMLEEVEIL